MQASRARSARYAWLPYGGGIRRCIGAAVAQAELAEVIRTVPAVVDSSRYGPTSTRW